MYTALQASTAFKIARETIRKWCLEFGDYLSPSANPGKNRDRHFNDDDMRVLALVSEMKAAGRTYSDIHAALGAGQRGEIPEVRPIPSGGERNRLLVMEKDIQDLRAALNDALEDRQRQAGQIELLQQQLKAAQEKADKLRDENAVLRYRLKLGDKD